MLNDIRYTLRQFRKAPGFALTAVALLALGLGANIAVFTLLNGILLRPMPYANPARLVRVEAVSPMPFYSLNFANIQQLADAAGSRIQVATSFDHWGASIVGPGGRMQVQHSTLGPGFFDLLGVRPILGRTFRADESDPGSNRVVVIGEQVWSRLFHSDPNIVGKTLAIRGDTYSIIGVMPRRFSFPYGDPESIWSPYPVPPAARSAMSGENSLGAEMFARLPAGMTPEQFAADLNRTQPVIAREIPDGDLPTRVRVVGYQDFLNHRARQPLLLLYVVVVGIWALACLNVTSLMLVRAVSRTREQAVRSALGASRLRLMRQSVVESLILSGFGATAGLLLGQSIIKLLWRQIDLQLPLTSTIHMDWRVLACLFVLTLLTAAIVGTYPALRASGRNVQPSLHGVTSTASAGQNRTREALVAAQIALTLVFLVGAGLFLRTIDALRQVPLGFEQQNVLTGGVILNTPSRQDKDAANAKTNVVRTAYLPLLERLRAIPGVQVAALSSVLPLRSEFAVSIMSELDHKKVPYSQTPHADGRIASPGLVDALGIPMVRGRFFTDEDTGSSPVVIVVNKAFVDKYLPGQDPIGHVLGLGHDRFGEMRIVGEIGDVKQASLTDPTKPEVYFCLAQTEPGTPLYGIATAFIEVAIRARVPADALRVQFDKVLHEVAPDATTTDVKTIHEAVEDSFGSQMLIARLLETFAILALAIASVGIYGLLSFAVAQRTREIGLRIAFGALQSNILSLVLRRALLLVCVGLGVGFALAWFAVSMARSYIFGVEAHDAITFAVVPLVLAVASFLAAWLPARRAASIDPILALRSE